MSKKVSIIIPAYNASDYLGEAIDSALSQTYTDFEILVINDGSTDNGATRDVALSYGDKILYYEKENGGCASALNFGIEHMNGFWFSWLSHDDLYLPKKLENLVSLIDRYSLDPTKTVLACNDLIMGPSGKVYPNHFNNSIGLLNPVQAFAENLYIKTFNGCGLLIPKSILDQTGGFKTDYKHLLDRELWMRIAICGFDICFADMPLVISRVHNKQITVRAQESLYKEEEMLIQNYSDILSNKPEFLKHLCYFAYKRMHYNLGRSIVNRIKEMNELNLSARAQIIYYYIQGRLKNIIRNRYKAHLRNK